ncbi:hypothetical protein D3878_13780 [Noviherbaspirillum sedimenti]|uniref:Solute-binding protein family 3/N-terminal domain-containing protein n=1 Tax=Noviherbaspirillum sedimenti TaxID=2320865 RepID=A0A3A3G8X1_9BURK|nr:hypothetical protein D3878_13780 [Noviherbaspirillum sedimenti]
MRVYPTGPIYDFRWKLLELALAHTQDDGGVMRLQPQAEEATQNRAMLMLQAGTIDVIALGTNVEREAMARPVRIDILRGIVGYRVFVIRAADQPRIARMEAGELRQLTFGLNSQWADLPIMRANGFTVETSTSHENLYGMLEAHRFDAFPRGLNEATRELAQHHHLYPQLTLESSKALYFPYPVYFWVSRTNTALASRIERGLQLALADGSFRKLFERYHAEEIAALQKDRRQVLRLRNPALPKNNAEPDTRWWWRQ